MMALFVIIFTLLAVTCVLAMYLDGKIQKHIFVHHHKLWKSFGFPPSSRWFADPLASDFSEYNIAEIKLITFVKSPKCEELGDVELLRLKALNKLAHKIVTSLVFCTLVVGYITLFTA